MSSYSYIAIPACRTSIQVYARVLDSVHVYVLEYYTCNPQHRNTGHAPVWSPGSVFPGSWVSWYSIAILQYRYTGTAHARVLLQYQYSSTSTGNITTHGTTHTCTYSTDVYRYRWQMLHSVLWYGGIHLFIYLVPIAIGILLFFYFFYFRQI